MKKLETFEGSSDKKICPVLSETLKLLVEVVLRAMISFTGKKKADFENSQF